MPLPQVSLRLDEVRLEQCSGLFLLQLGAPGPEVFLKLPCFRNEVVGDTDDFSLCDGLACRGRVVSALVKSRLEDFEWFVGIVGLLEIPSVIHQFCRQYSHIVFIELAEEGQHGGSRVAGERVLDGG